jgi:phosphoglycerate dehydrogenase-like enzyme
MSTDERPLVLSTFQFSASAQGILREAGNVEIYCTVNRDEFLKRLPDAEIACTFWLPDNWHLLTKRLRWLQCPGAGVDSLLSTGILSEDSDVRVTTAIGIYANTIGEYVFGSMLMFNRSWSEMVRLQDRHVWPLSANWYHLRQRELTGSTLGIVGLGTIGRRVAQLGQAFGMRVLATRRSVQRGEQEPDVDQIFPLTQLHEMLRQSDYVVVAVPLTRQTEKLIGAAELRAMRGHAYLVNVARGRVVDEQALIRALQEGWIGGAGLDVVEQEPLIADSPLYSLPNVILTPHISGSSDRYNERLTALFAENLRRYRAGEPLLNQYDPARGY